MRELLSSPLTGVNRKNMMVFCCADKTGSNFIERRMVDLGVQK
jgi:hypothetical protein